MNIFLTPALTVLGGVIIYVLGQFLSKFLIEPIYELKKTIGEVRFNLTFHAPIIHTPISRTPARSEKTYEALMKSSCDLLTRMEAIPCYSYLSSHSRGFLPSKQAIVNSAENLRGLSTYISETGDKADNSIDIINKRVERIEKNLFSQLTR